MRIKVERISKNFKYTNQLNLENLKYKENSTGIKGRKYCNIDNEFISKKLFELYNITNYEKETRLGDTIFLHYLKGSHAQLHKDIIDPSKYHVRCNLLIKKAKQGGDILIDEMKYELNENDVWIVIANKELHGTTPIEDGERIIYSTGAILDDKQIQKLI